MLGKGLETEPVGMFVHMFKVVKTEIAPEALLGCFLKAGTLGGVSPGLSPLISTVFSLYCPLLRAR